jgi:hypothetical protein
LHRYAASWRARDGAAPARGVGAVNPVGETPGFLREAERRDGDGVAVQHAHQTHLVGIRRAPVDEVLGHARARTLIRGALERLQHHLHDAPDVLAAQSAHGDRAAAGERHVRALERAL